MGKYILPEIITCGYFDCLHKFGSQKQSPKRIASGTEIELYLEDGIATYINEQEYPILKNHIIISKAGSERYSILPFKTIFLKLNADAQIADTLNELPCFFHAIHVGQIIDLLNDIILLNEEQNINYLMLGAKILILIELLQQDAAMTDTMDSRVVSSMHLAKKYIEMNYSNKISSEEVAAHINLSESYFRVLFKKTYGITAHQYLINKRISAAKQMLWDGNYSMSEIAEKCGFGSQQYFNDTFKRQTGLSPGTYINSFERKYSDG